MEADRSREAQRLQDAMQSAPATEPPSAAIEAPHGSRVADNHTTAHDRSLWAWGSNDFGELGDGTTTERANPVRVMGANDIKTIEAGGQVVHVLHHDGTVWGWGSNSDGKLGDGTQTSRGTPVQVRGLSDVVAIASWDAAYALKSDGSVWAWGSNNGGQLGDGTRSPHSLPTRVSGIPPMVDVAASGGTGFGLATDGSVWAWGHDGHGEFGGARGAGTFGPAQVMCFVDGREWILGGVKAICAGIFSGYALREDGTVWSWGANDAAQLGNGEVSSNVEHLLGSLTAHNAASQVIGLTEVVAISSKGINGYALKSDGMVWAWGSNNYGQLGLGSTQPRCSPVPVQVRGLSEVVAISSAGDSAYALRRDGTLWAWGENDYGELGDGTEHQRSHPVHVTGLMNVVEVSAGIIAAYAICG